MQFAMRGFHYLRLGCKFEVKGATHHGCLDTGATLSSIDRTFLSKVAPKATLQKLDKPMNLHGLGKAVVDDFVVLTFWVPAIVRHEKIMVEMEHPFLVLPDLDANFLVGMDIIGSEQIQIDIPRRWATIGSCEDAKVQLLVNKQDDKRFQSVVQTADNVTVEPLTVCRVPVSLRKAIPTNRDFEFIPEDESLKNNALGMYSHLADHTLSHVLVRNDSKLPQAIAKGTRLGRLKELDVAGFYQLDPADHGLATTRPRRPDPQLESELPNGVTVFGKPDEADRLAEVVRKHERLWVDKGTTVKVDPDRYMRVNLVDDWKERASKLSSKIYPLGHEENEVVRTVFGKMREQGKMEYTSKPTPFGFPVFVVWKVTVVDGVRKRVGRPVVDIRPVNGMAVKDSYPLPLQSDIITALLGCRYITVIDAVSFFYQWLVAEDDRHKFTVNTIDGQMQFNVAVMGYCGSVQYV
jgi:hypothetical protein